MFCAMCFILKNMDKFVISGGKELKGEIEIAGSKNTILPCIAASLLTEEEIILENVPEISDVASMIEILQTLGAEVNYDKPKKILAVNSKKVSSFEITETLGKKLRASILLSGPLLGRFKKAALPYPGGDNIGRRPLTTHLNALIKLGVSKKENDLLELNAENFKSAPIILEEPSVTATENTILASVLMPGTTEIHLAAAEPHVQNLIALLNLMGAKISWKDIGVIKIDGVKKLKGAEFKMNPDEIEISGFAALAAATRSSILLRNVEFKYIDAVLLQLSKMKIPYRKIENDLLIEKNPDQYEAFRIQAGLYPKLISDHLPPFAVLATQAKGESLIHEWLYEGRLKYVEELQKMGASTKILDPHRAIIKGPTRLKGTELISYDVRAGLTVIIAALVAEGETRISGIEHVERGYEKVEQRLQKIGASIKRVG